MMVEEGLWLVKRISPIIKGSGMIGGKDQSGEYKIDCRYNRANLVRRIRRVARYRRRIHLYMQDAIDFLKATDEMLPSKSLLCIDPPYFNKGSSLYTSFYKPGDHVALANAIGSLNRPWLLTYDDAEAIRSLYNSRALYLFDVRYSVQTKRVGTELLVASSELMLPPGVLNKRVA